MMEYRVHIMSWLRQIQNNRPQDHPFPDLHHASHANSDSTSCKTLERSSAPGRQHAANAEFLNSVAIQYPHPLVSLGRALSTTS